ncbi:hypothetical protein CcaCcLH18_10465 [Colletotrichum camelliae]|nr:hypothetical protein CcaCcLH18_10465 [Colletotrichum camelliae]
MQDQATLDRTRAFVETLPPNERRASEELLLVAEMMNEEARQEAEAERRASSSAVVTHEADETVEQINNETVEQITNETIEELHTVTNDDNVASHGTVSAETTSDGSGGENTGVANVVTASDAVNNIDANFDNTNANFHINANFNASLNNGRYGYANFASVYSNIEYGAPSATVAPNQLIASQPVEATRVVEIVGEESESASEQPSVGSQVVSPSTAQTTPPAPSDSPVMPDAVKPAAAPASQPNGQEFWQKTANRLPWNVGGTELTGTLPNNALFAMAQAAHRGANPCKKPLPAHSQPATTAKPIVAGTSAGEYQSPYRPPCRQRPGHAAGHRTFNQFPSGGRTMMNKAPASTPTTLPSSMPVPIPTGMPTTTSTAMAATAPTDIPSTAPASAQIPVKYGMMNFQGGGGMPQQQMHMAPNVPLTGVQNQHGMDSRALNAPQTGCSSPGFNGFNNVPFMGQFQHNTQPTVSPAQPQFSIPSQGMAHGFQKPSVSIAELRFENQWMKRQIAQQQMEITQQQMTMERQQMQLNALMKSKMPSTGQGNLTPTRSTCNHKKRPSTTTQEPSTGMTIPPAKKVRLQRPPAESNMPAKSGSPRHTHKHKHTHKHASA